MAKTQILEYTIHLRDKALVDALNAQLATGVPDSRVGVLLRDAVGDYRVHRAPYAVGPPEAGAAVEFGNGLTLPRVVVGAAVPTVATAPNGYLTSPWFTSASTALRTDVASFHQSTGWWIFGHDTLFYWGAKFAYAPAAAAWSATGPTQEPAPIATRYWIDGGELGQQGAGGGGTEASRDAAREVGGFGTAIYNATGTVQSHRVTTQGFTAPGGAWERLYVRVRKFSAASCRFWSANWNLEYTSAITGQIRLQVGPTGQLIATTVDNFGSEQIVATSGNILTTDTWARLDLLAEFRVVGSEAWAFIRVYVNNVLVLTGSGRINTTPVAAAYEGCILGTGYVGNTLELDVDDWRASSIPKDKDTTVAAWSAPTAYAVNDYVRSGGLNYRCSSAHTSDAVTGPFPGSGAPWVLQVESRDWKYGSSVQMIRPLAHGGASVWTGDAAGLALRPGFNVNEGLTSSTSGALLAVTTDMAAAVARPNVQGFAALQPWIYSLKGSVDGTLGYALDGGAAVMQTIAQSAAFTWKGCAPYNLPALTKDLADPNHTLELRHAKGADVSAARVKSLCAVVELIGIFGPEDLASGDTSTPAPLASRGPHNGPYPRTPWAVQETPPLSPVVLKTGSYVGTGTGVDLLFSAPVHFLYIRPITGGAGGVKWWSSQLTGHLFNTEDAGRVMLTDASEDLTFVPAGPTADQQRQFKVHLSGNSAQVNALGVTYQYFAFMDPGARFCAAGAATARSASLPAVRPLRVPGFTPEAMFGLSEDVGGTGTQRMWFKGTGHAASEASLIHSGAAVASALTFGSNAITLGTGLSLPTGLDQFSFIGFRRHDGNSDANEAAVLQVGTYVGDGAASRTIGLTSSSKRPLFVYVQPHNGNPALVRDPAHTTVTSSTVADAANASTGITGGGVDSFSVGATLNTNAVTYSWIAFMGSATAGNGGWSIDGTYAPVAADSPTGTPYLVEPVVLEESTTPDDDDVVADPGDLVTDIAASCLSASTRLVNLALSRCGVAGKVVDLATDLSAEADAARTVYKTELDATLRDFPWPFATRYATLTLVAGTEDDAVNGDWQYSYRAPTGSLLVRRIVDPTVGRRWSATPIPFRMGQDATGDLIYCDEPGEVLEADADVDVEYTWRPDCPASVADPIFRSAAAWRLAAALAVPLGRDIKLADRAQRNYLLELEKAKLVHAQEQQQQDSSSAFGDAEWIRARE